MTLALAAREAARLAAADALEQPAYASALVAADEGDVTPIVDPRRVRERRAGVAEEECEAGDPVRAKARELDRLHQHPRQREAQDIVRGTAANAAAQRALRRPHGPVMAGDQLVERAGRPTLHAGVCLIEPV